MPLKMLFLYKGAGRAGTCSEWLCQQTRMEKQLCLSPKDGYGLALLCNPINRLYQKEDFVFQALQVFMVSFQKKSSQDRGKCVIKFIHVLRPCA